MVKRLPAMRETRVQSLGLEDPLRRKWQSTPVLLPGKFPGWRSPVGDSPWGCKESDTTEQFPLAYLVWSWMASGQLRISLWSHLTCLWFRADKGQKWVVFWTTDELRGQLLAPLPLVSGWPQGLVLHFCVFHLSLLPQSSLWWMTTTEPLLQAPGGRSEIHLNSPATLSRRNACDPIYRWRRWGPEKCRHIPGILGRYGVFTMFPGGLLFAGAFIILCGCWVWSLQGEVHSWGFLPWLSPCSGCRLT